MRDYSVQWTGYLTPAEPGKYEVGLGGSMNRFWFDGKLILDDATLHDSTPKTVTVYLKKGHCYPVKIQYFRGTLVRE